MVLLGAVQCAQRYGCAGVPHGPAIVGAQRHAPNGDCRSALRRASCVHVRKRSTPTVRCQWRDPIESGVPECDTRLTVYRCSWRVWWSVAACRDLWGNNIGGELPVQYSALTNLQVWCDPLIRAGGCP